MLFATPPPSAQRYRVHPTDTAASLLVTSNAPSSTVPEVDASSTGHDPSPVRCSSGTSASDHPQRWYRRAGFAGTRRCAPNRNALLRTAMNERESGPRDTIEFGIPAGTRDAPGMLGTLTNEKRS